MSGQDSRNARAKKYGDHAHSAPTLWHGASGIFLTVPCLYEPVVLYYGHCEQLLRSGKLATGSEREWTVLMPLVPAAKAGGRPRTTDMREVVNALFYTLRSGCQWRMLPTDFPPHQTVYDSFRTWRRAGVWERMHDTLRGELREAAGRRREPSAGIIDSQTVKTTEKGGSAAITEASAYRGASATLSSMSLGFSWS